MTAWPDPNAPRTDVDAFIRVATAQPTATPTGPCALCQHTHAGPEFAGICIGCPCPGVEASPAPPPPGASPAPSPVAVACGRLLEVQLSQVAFRLQVGDELPSVAATLSERRLALYATCRKRNMLDALECAIRATAPHLLPVASK